MSDTTIIRGQFDISHPTGVGTPTRVRRETGSGSGSGAVFSGWVCGHGPVTESRDSGRATDVWAQVIGQSAEPDPSPNTSVATRGRILNNGTLWLVARGTDGLTDVPGAMCTSSPAHPRQKLAVWVKFANEANFTRGAVVFEGLCADDTACGMVGSGSGSGNFQLALAGGWAGTAVALAPARWGLTVAGVINPLGAALNRTWALDLENPVGPTSVWSNGGDGIASPRVELTCTGPPAPRWRLHLRHDLFSAEYTAPATDWQALAAVTVAVVAPGGLPPTLTLTPG